jgi:crotonobetainyl-CoA:carnitine CoA-transferase CaiB-like acyl-CoA transferase
MEEPRWQDTSYMLEHVEELRSLVRGALASAKKDDIAPLAPAAGLPWAPVCDATEVAACPQLQARGFWRSHGGELDAGLPLQIAASKPAPPGRSPRKRTIPAVGTGPLAGLVVVELTVAWAGPFAGMLMAQAGATVIKVESARKPDTARSFPIMDDLLTENWWDRSLSFYVANNSKHFVGLELDRPGGIEIVERLAAEADVLINNHSPRVFDNLGMTFERLAEINPDLVYLESTGFGHNGPYRDRGALGWSLEAMSGVNAYHGYPGGEPMWSRMTFPDTFGALHGALGVAATLIANARRPAATWLDVSQYEAGVHGALPALLDDVAEGRAGHRLGNRHRVFAPQGVFACVGEEQWVALAVNDEAQWRALAGLTGMPAALVALDSHAARHAHHDAIDDAIARWTVRRGKVEAERALQAAGVPAGAVLDSREIFDGEHFARHGWVPAASRECGARAYPAPWQRFEDGATGVAWATSSFGEHNDLVLGEWLGLRDELPRLRKAGVVVDRPTYAVAPSTGGLLPERLLQLREIRAHDPEYRAAERALIARSMELNAPPR